MRRIAVLAGLLALTAACTAVPPTSEAPSSATTPPVTEPLVASPAPPPPPPPCEPVARACVSLSAKLAWLTRNGRPDHGPVPISYGTRRNPTPVGRFAVSWKDRDNTSSIYGTPMPYSVFFAPGGIAFHGGDVRTASHGCIHLPMAAARVFFNRLHPGDVVQVVR
jgi:L,D-transpeptidase catalytic domain